MYKRTVGREGEGQQERRRGHGKLRLGKALGLRKEIADLLADGEDGVQLFLELTLGAEFLGEFLLEGVDLLEVSILGGLNVGSEDAKTVVLLDQKLSVLDLHDLPLQLGRLTHMRGVWLDRLSLGRCSQCCWRCTRRRRRGHTGEVRRGTRVCQRRCS